ncbi:MAG: hypothetical protein ACOZNI_36240 [Myxococcota bacterium]
MHLLLAVASAAAAPPGWNLVPFGVGVYLHERPARGVAYSVTQAAGVAATAWGTAMVAEASEAGDDGALDQWSVVSSIGVGTAAASYFVSIFDAGRLHDLEREEAEKTARAVRAWDAAVLAAREQE